IYGLLVYRGGGGAAAAATTSRAAPAALAGWGLDGLVVVVHVGHGVPFSGASVAAGGPHARGSHRAPSRSIHCCVLRTRPTSRSGTTTASTSLGRTPRGWVASSNVSCPGPLTETASTDGRRSSVTDRPLRSRVAGRVAAAMTE